MQECKYTYQDWVDGKTDSIIWLEYETEAETENARGNIYDALLESMERSDFDKIAKEQSIAFSTFLNKAFEKLVIDFKADYNQSMLKRAYLKGLIDNFKEQIDEMEAGNPHIEFQAMYPQSDGRHKLTKKQVEHYLSASLNDSKLGKVIFGIYLNIDDDKTPFAYILRKHFYNWLLWFEDQQGFDSAEPKINVINPESNFSSTQSLPPFSLRYNGQVSYKWLNKPDTELPELHQFLIDNKLIYADTPIERFKAVFKAKPLAKVEPIKWHDDNASELLYFILQLESSGNIEPTKRTDYKRLQACFIKPDGEPFGNAFKSLKQRIDIDLSEQKQQTIREIIGNF